MNIQDIKRYRVTIDDETIEIGTAAELAIALDVLNGTRDRALLEQLAPHLAEILGDGAGLILVYKSLTSADQIFATQTLGAQFASVLGSAQTLRDLLALLADATVEQTIIATLGADGLRALIHHASELAQILHWLYGDVDNQVLTLLGADYVRRLVHNGNELSLALDAMHEKGEREFLDMLGQERIRALISDGRDLAYVLRALPPQESIQILQGYSPAQLASLIDNANDWAYLWKRLEPAEAKFVAEKLGVDAYAA